MIRRYMTLLKAALIVSDLVAAFVLFLILFAVRFDILDGLWLPDEVRPVEFAALWAILWVAGLWVLGLYSLRSHWTFRGEVADVLRATITVAVATLSLLYLLQITGVSRLFLIMLWISQPLLTIWSRAMLRLLLRRVRSRGHLTRNMLVVGTGPEAVAFASAVERHREYGLHVVGHLSTPAEQAQPSDGRQPTARRIIGTIDDIEEVLHSNVVDEVAICLTARDWSYVEPVTRVCEEEGKIVRVSIQSLGVLTGGTFEDLAGLPIVSFLYGPDRFLGMAFKRAFDIVVSAGLLVVLSPLMIGIALYIRLADGPPVLFRQRRVGLHGRPFTCLKFRTMVSNAEELYPELADAAEDARGFKLDPDPRVTRIGHRLRRTSLDELPQLINVLRGEMSIVGPRPAPPREVDLYSVWHRRRLSMRPGLTGLWQVLARTDANFDRRVSLDLDYIDRWSLWMDFKILVRTLPVLVTQNGR